MKTIPDDCMRISDLERLLNDFRHAHGDLPILLNYATKNRCFTSKEDFHLDAYDAVKILVIEH